MLRYLKLNIYVYTISIDIHRYPKMMVQDAHSKPTPAEIERTSSVLAFRRLAGLEILLDPVLDLLGNVLSTTTTLYPRITLLGRDGISRKPSASQFTRTYKIVMFQHQEATSYHPFPWGVILYCSSLQQRQFFAVLVRPRPAHVLKSRSL